MTAYLVVEESTGLVDGYFTKEMPARLKAAWWTTLLKSICTVEPVHTMAVMPACAMLNKTPTYHRYLKVREKMKP